MVGVFPTATGVAASGDSGWVADPPHEVMSSAATVAISATASLGNVLMATMISLG